MAKPAEVQAGFEKDGKDFLEAAIYYERHIWKLSEGDQNRIPNAGRGQPPICGLLRALVYEDLGSPSD